MQIGPSGEFDFGPSPSMSDILASYTGSLPADPMSAATTPPTPSGTPPSNNVFEWSNPQAAAVAKMTGETPAQVLGRWTENSPLFAAIAKHEGGSTGQTTGGSGAPSTTSDLASLTGNLTFPTGAGSGYGQKIGHDLLTFGGGGRSGQDTAPGLRGDNFARDYAAANVAATPDPISAGRIAASMSPTGLAGDVIGLGMEAAGIPNPFGPSPFDVGGPMLSPDVGLAMQKAMADLPINAPLSDVMAAMNNVLNPARAAATASATAGGHIAGTGSGPGAGDVPGAPGYGSTANAGGVSRGDAYAGGGRDAAQGGSGGGGQGGVGDKGPMGGQGGQGANAGF